MVVYLREIFFKSKEGDKYGDYMFKVVDDFIYIDLVDGSVVVKQGIWFVFIDGFWIIFWLLGIGLVGVIIWLYVEKFEFDVLKYEVDVQEVLKLLIEMVFLFFKLQEFIGWEKFIVIIQVVGEFFVLVKILILQGLVQFW